MYGDKALLKSAFHFYEEKGGCPFDCSECILDRRNHFDITNQRQCHELINSPPYNQDPIFIRNAHKYALQYLVNQGEIY